MLSNAGGWIIITTDRIAAWAIKPRRPTPNDVANIGRTYPDKHTMKKNTATIGSFLIARLEELGLKHIFGIPGDYVLQFYDQLMDRSLFHHP